MTDAKKEPIFTPTALTLFKNAFDAFDDNRDGLVSVEYLSKLLRAVGYNPTPAETDDMILDISSPVFNFTAFLYLIALHGRANDPDHELIAAFQLFDTNGSGTVTTTTIRHILGNLKEPFTQDEIGELLGQSLVDAKTDTVNYTAFVQIIRTF
jgi:calmodulin